MFFRRLDKGSGESYTIKAGRSCTIDAVSVINFPNRIVRVRRDGCLPLQRYGRLRTDQSVLTGYYIYSNSSNAMDFTFWIVL